MELWKKLNYSSLKEYTDRTCIESGGPNCHYNCDDCREDEQFQYVPEKVFPGGLAKIRLEETEKEADKQAGFARVMSKADLPNSQELREEIKKYAVELPTDDSREEISRIVQQIYFDNGFNWRMKDGYHEYDPNYIAIHDGVIVSDNKKIIQACGYALISANDFIMKFHHDPMGLEVWQKGGTVKDDGLLGESTKELTCSDCKESDRCITTKYTDSKWPGEYCPSFTLSK